MSTNLEIEFKSMLTKEEYETIISSFSNHEIYIQNNFYIDSKSRQIEAKKCGLRIREKDDEFELTLKVPYNEGKIEINQQISNIDLEKLQNRNIFPDGEVKDYIESNLCIKTNELSILGNLLTHRLDIPYKSSLISVDKSMYNSIIDYEIECENESLEKAKENLKEFLDKFGFEIKKSPKSKLKRFLDTLNY